jgi:hypothetical protein
MPNRIETLLYSLQESLTASLSSIRTAVTHPGAKGDASEENWIAFFKAHLPNRYQADKAFVIDSDGQCSDQIDVVIYDRQYTPMLFNRDGQRFMPAESVYAVFEVKQDMSREHIQYAGAKAASVRRLRRTSAAIPHAGGQYQPRALFQIVAGLLTYDSGWSPAFGTPFMKVLKQGSEQERIDIGVAASAGAFDAQYSGDGTPSVRLADRSVALTFFFFSLLDRLQKLGTVSAIDYSAYSAVLAREKDPSSSTESNP